MAQAPIQAPSPAYTERQWLKQRVGLAEASSGAFKQGQFVKASGSGVGATLTVVAGTATSAETVYGLANRDAIGSSGEPYLTPTGTTHFVTDVIGGKFWVNTMGTGQAVGTGSGTALVLGSTYELRSFTTSGYTNVMGIMSSSAAASTAGFWKYEGQIHPDDATGDTNPRVLCSVAAPRNP